MSDGVAGGMNSYVCISVNTVLRALVQGDDKQLDPHLGSGGIPLILLSSLLYCVYIELIDVKCFIIYVFFTILNVTEFVLYNIDISKRL